MEIGILESKLWMFMVLLRSWGTIRRKGEKMNLTSASEEESELRINHIHGIQNKFAIEKYGAH